MILTDKEREYWIGGNQKKMALCRAIEIAVLDKLASAELPEPALPKGVGMCASFKLDYFTADQLTAWGNTRYAQGAAAQLSAEPVAIAEGHDLLWIAGKQLDAERDHYLYTRRQA